jgi:mono/diheme cytochrome c family protein
MVLRKALLGAILKLGSRPEATERRGLRPARATDFDRPTGVSIRGRTPVIAADHEEGFALQEPIEDPGTRPSPGIDPVAARRVGLGVIVLASLAGLAFVLLRKPPSPPPDEIAGDPLLKAGHAVYLDRCVSCHGPKGRGDGPIAKGLAGPPVGDLTDEAWKHGDRPEQVRGVIAVGVPKTSMPGWGRTLGPDDLRSVTAYVYHLSRREVPTSLRTP